ncbi:MAG: hydantoinase B/oxoprolinase family protein [Alphaproteobacteria bacterium]|nr:hydantoinase B/oxoprolinase family protein [Alphaproteobacteria bacterium]
MPPAGAADPIAMEVFSNRLLSITEEMGHALIRASFSSNVKERKDCSVGLFDARGRCVAQASHMPMHLGSLMGSVLSVLDHTPVEAMEEGDAFVCNDTFLARGTHQPDINIVTPVFIDGRVAFFTANVGHHSDVGGPHPGSMSQRARSIYEEGLRIPVMRLVRAGKLDKDLLGLIAHNSREPEERSLDLGVQIAVNNRGAELVRRLVAGEGLGSVQRSIDDLLAYTGRRIRARIAALPDGDYHGERWMDGDGVDVATPIPIRVRVSIRGSDLLLDFDGTAAQAKGALNMVRNALEATCFYATKAMLDPELPPNSGLFDAVRITAPEGTIVNPRFPAATATRAITGNRVAGAIFQAFQKALPPERAMAASNDSVPALVTAGHRRSGAYVYLETIGGGAGARWGGDGQDAIHVHTSNTSNLPAEALEIEYPLLLNEYALVPDSGGAGRWRGGLAIARELCARVDGTLITARADGHVATAPGVAGGLDGGAAHLTIYPGTPHERALETNATAIPLKAGEAVRMETAGGGGLGSPAERDLRALAADILDGKVSRAAAERDHGAARVAAALRDWKEQEGRS